MNLDRLRLFLDIVDTGSVSAAGRKAHLTQPAVSRSLKQLEEEIGVELFAREGRGVLLTAAGRALVPHARGLVREAERARVEVKRVAQAAYFDLRVGAVESIGIYVLPPAFERLREQHPDLKLKLWLARTQELLERVEAATLDLAFIAYSGPPSERAVRVGTYALQYYGLRDRFAQLANMTSDRQLQELPIVEMQALPGQPTAIRPDADAFALVQNLGAVKALVLGGLGIGQLLPFMLSADERKLLVGAERLQHDPECGIYCVRSPREMSAIEQQVVETLISTAREQLC
jgi:DNA-binding transcriptional LysR family regulator